MGRSGIRFLHKEFDMQVRRWLLLPILVAAVTAGVQDYNEGESPFRQGG